MIGPTTYVLLLLNTANVTLHSVGAYLLLSVYKSSKYKVQQIYLINLSITELLTNLLEITRIVMLLSYGDNQRLLSHRIRNNLLIVSFTGVSLVYYFDMVYITLDRLLDIVLNIKYPVYWNEKRAFGLLIVTWMAGISTCVTVTICDYYTNFNWADAFFKYFYPPLGIFFILLAIVTYCFIFYKYKHALLNPPSSLHGAEGNRRIHMSGFVLFRKSRFYVSVLLIITFILFMIAPDMTYLIVGILYKNPSEALLNGCWICYALSNLADGYIYIFVQDNVRKAFREKILVCFKDQVEPVLYLSSLRTTDQKKKTYNVDVSIKKEGSASRRIIITEKPSPTIINTNTSHQGVNHCTVNLVHP